MSTQTQGQNTVRPNRPYGEYDPNMAYGQDTPFNPVNAAPAIAGSANPSTAGAAGFGTPSSMGASGQSPWGTSMSSSSPASGGMATGGMAGGVGDQSPWGTSMSSATQSLGYSGQSGPPGTQGTASLSQAGGYGGQPSMQNKAGGEPMYQGPSPEPVIGGNRMPEYDQTGAYGMPLTGALSQNLAGTNYSAPASSYNFSFGPSRYEPNPYLDQQAETIRRGFNRNLQETVLPGLRSRFIGSGGLGGSRQGIAEGLAAARSGEGLSSAITNMYAQDYENSQNRGLQGQIAGMNAGLQARSMDLNDQIQRLNSERNFYTSQRGQDLSQLGLAAGLLGQANQGFLNQGQGIYGIGQQEQNAPWQQLQNYSGLLGPYQQAGATNAGTQQYMYNPTQQWIGTAAQVASMFSDVRLKENIKRVGKTDEGLGVYTYNYKGDDTPQMGVMAQEVAVKKPEALGPTVNGFMSVRYGLLGD